MFVVEGFLLLRMFFFFKFMYALKGLLEDWQASEQMVGLLFPRWTRFFAMLMVLIIIACAFSVLFGFYGQIGGLLTFLFCLLGMRLHMILKRQAESLVCSDGDKTCSQLKVLAVLGQSACAQKNTVIAGVGVFFLCVGTGPYSLTANLF